MFGPIHPRVFRAIGGQIHVLYRSCGRIPGLEGIMHQSYCTKTVTQMFEETAAKDSGKQHGLHEKLEMLKSFGCTIEQVQECPEILALDTDDYVMLAKKLKSLSCLSISVQFLTLAKYSTTKTLREKVREPFLRTKLQCTEIEMHQLKQKAKFLNTVSNMDFFSKKVDLLLENGASIEELKLRPFVLQKSLETIQTRVSEIRKLSSDIKLPLSVLAQRKRFYEQWIQNYIEECDVLGEHKNKYELVASLLQVGVSDVEDLEYIKKMSAKLLRTRIQYFLDIGIERTEIFNFDYMLLWSQKVIEGAIKETREAGFEKITLWNLINLVHHKTISKRKFIPRKAPYLSNMLQMSMSELCSQNLQCVWSTDKIQIRFNFEFLIGNGFSLEDIQKCAFLLGHSSTVLVQHYENLPKREELKMFYGELSKDKIKILNILQYFIERENNFSKLVVTDEAEEFY